MGWTIEGRRARAESGPVVTFDFDVKATAEVRDILVVVLDVPPGQILTENVFGVSAEAQIRWQIQRILETGTDPANSYVGVTVKDAGKGIVSVTNWNGCVVDVNIRTGAVVGRRWLK